MLKLFKKNKNQISLPPTHISVFKIMSILLFFLGIFLYALSYATSETGIKKLALCYVSSADVNDIYFDNFIQNGFTYEECESYLYGKELKKIVADVMADKFSVLFDYSDEFDYSIEMCQSDVQEHFISFCNDNNIEMKADTISTLVLYTCDITGISQMYRYDTPAAYRDSIFESNPEKYKNFDSILEKVSVLSQLKIPISVTFMYIVCLIIYIIFHINHYRDIKKLAIDACDISLIPSLILTGFSLGEVLGLVHSTTIQDYIFGVLLKVSIIGIIYSIFLLFIIKLLAKNMKSVDNESN